VATGLRHGGQEGASQFFINRLEKTYFTFGPDGAVLGWLAL
jgi:hypothetical protein